jgi:hypothetical protein
MSNEEKSPVTWAQIVRCPFFKIGVDDLRTGAPPRFDIDDGNFWAYERGRLWAVLAPRNMEPKGPKAVTLLVVAMRRGWIV